MDKRKYALKSSLISVGSQIITILITFLIRKTFIEYIGMNHMGLNTVLTDVLGLLSISELGIQSALTYQLYDPLTKNDREKINEIMELLRKVYKKVGAAIGLLGICLFPVLRYLINDETISMTEVYIAFAILLISSCTSYFISYKRTLLYADQKQYVISIIDVTVCAISGILRVVSIVCFHSFYLFLLVSVFQNIASNVIINVWSKKSYRWIRRNIQIRSEIKRTCYKDVKNVFVGKLAGFIYGSTDNVIISVFVGTLSVGYIGNYKSIANVAKMIMSYLFLPIQPMIGNYLEKEDKTRAYRLYRTYTLIRQIFACVILIPILLFSHRVIFIWLGEKYILNEGYVLLMVIDLYLSCIQGSAGEFVIALGYFKYDKYISLVGMILNLICSVIGALKWGIYGVLIGTVVSQVAMWGGKKAVILRSFFEQSLKGIISDFLKDGLQGMIFMLCTLVGHRCMECVSCYNLLLETMIEIVILEVFVGFIYGIFCCTGEGKYIRDFFRK